MSLRFGYCYLKGIGSRRIYVLFLLTLFQMLLSSMGKGPVYHGNCDLFRGKAGSRTSRVLKLDNHYTLSADWFSSGEGVSAKWSISWHL